VLLEKPVALNVEDAESMRLAARSAKRLLMPAHLLRFDQRYLNLHRVSTDLASGPLLRLYARRNVSSSMLPVYGRTHPVFESLTHDFDLGMWFGAYDIRSMSASEVHAPGSGTPIGIVVTCELESGALAVYESIWGLPDGFGSSLDVMFEVMHENALLRLSIPGSGDSGTAISSSGRQFLDDHYWPRGHDGSVGTQAAVVRHFLRCIRSTPIGDPVVTFDDAILGLRWAEAALASARTGLPVSRGDITNGIR
jgi:predicted dehydrogenase